jgi:hypothetical protein
MRGITGVCRDAGDDDAPTYWSDIRTAFGLARAEGFVRFDSLASRRGHNAQSVVNSVNAGTGLVIYRGSATGNWYDPFAVNPASTNSGWRLPVILSFTCATMTLAPGESMVGEAWLKAGTVTQPRGGVAFIGNTHSATHVAPVRSAMCRGFFAGLFGEDRYWLGQAFLRGKTQLYTEYPSSTYDYRGFNLLGDPTLDVWTGIPRRLTVDHPGQVEPVPQQLHVVVTSAAGPEDSATVCASMDSTVYSYGYTDANGIIDLTISPSHEGLLRLVVTGHNLFPYDTTVTVDHVGVEELTRPARALRLEACPRVFRTSTRLGWDRIITGTVEVRDASGRKVATLSASGTGVEWRPARIGAGAYVCVLSDQRGHVMGRVKLIRTD